MNLREMEYLVAIADLNNFSRASEHCNVSQPTLSAQIKKLEELLGVKIFERNNKHVMVTEEGAEIIKAARRILQEVRAIKDIAESAHDPLSGKFRIGAFPTISTYIFPKIVPEIKKIMPNLRLMLIEEKTASLIEKLHNGEIDAALISLPLQDDFFNIEELFEDKFYLAVPASHELTKYKQVNLHNLEKYRLLLLDEGHCLRENALEICHTNSINEEQDFRATSLETLRQMVRAGTGITLIPEIALNKGNDEGIIYIPFTKPSPHRTIGMVWRKTSIKNEIIKQVNLILKKAYLA